MLLHTVNKSPFLNAALASCIRNTKDGSGILLIEDGIYGALKNTENSALIEQAMENKKVYALGPDLMARGMQDRVIDGIEVVDYNGFVELSTKYDAVQAWL